jgi:hypothetical protein
MTKIDIGDQETRQTLKKEIIDEMQHDVRRRKVRNCLGCLFLVILAVTVPTAIVSVQLAKTGLVDIPLLTSRFYKPTEPSREVRPLVGSKSSDILLASASRAKPTLTLGFVTLSFTEAELTTLAKDGIAASGNNLPAPLKSIQVAVDQDAVEIFAVTPQHGRDVTVRARFLPWVDAGQMKITPKELVIGGLSVPPSLSGALTLVLNKSLGEVLTSTISQIGHLVAVELDKGVLRLQIVPNMQP